MWYEPVGNVQMYAICMSYTLISRTNEILLLGVDSTIIKVQYEDRVVLEFFFSNLLFE